MSSTEARSTARSANLALRDGEARYRAIFEQLPISIWVEDWSGVKTMIDRLVRRGQKNWRRYFERRPDQVGGQGLVSTVRQTDRPIWEISV